MNNEQYPHFSQDHEFIVGGDGLSRRAGCVSAVAAAGIVGVAAFLGGTGEVAAEEVPPDPAIGLVANGQPLPAQTAPDFTDVMNVVVPPSRHAAQADGVSAGTSEGLVVTAVESDYGSAIAASMLSVPDTLLNRPAAAWPAEGPAQAPAPAAPAPEAPAAVPALPADRRSTFFFQGDKEWASVPYYGAGGSRGKIGPNGCGPSTLAMVISSLTDHEVNPIDMANHNMRHGYVTASGSTTHKGLDLAPREFGLKTFRTKLNMDSIREVVDAGGWVIVNGTDENPNTPATDGGHIFAIRGITPDGRLELADPNSRRFTDEPQDPRGVLGPAKIAIAVINPNGPPTIEAPAPPPPPPAPEPAPAPEPPPLPVPHTPSNPGAGDSATILALSGNITPRPQAAAPPPATSSPMQLDTVLAVAETLPETELIQAPEPPPLPVPEVESPAAPAPAPELAPLPAPEMAAEMSALMARFPNFDVAEVPRVEWAFWVMASAAKYDLDPSYLAAQVEAESAWRDDVITGKTVSRTGAVGPSQFMPDTWEQYKVDANNNGIASPTDPPDAFMAQAHFMRDLMTSLRHIPGDPYEKAFAGYNAGGGRVKQYNGVPPESFADGETYNYVKKIMRIVGEYRD